VFDNPELARTQPFMHQLEPVFLGALPRPVTPKYPQVSAVLQAEVSRALATGDVEGCLDKAAAEIERIVAAD
jgi:multiple sugar transport system substrate-binding protein